MIEVLHGADPEDLAAWPDDRIWDELERRFETSGGVRQNRGPHPSKRRDSDA